MPFVIGIDGGGTKTACAFQAMGPDGQTPQRGWSATVTGEATNPLVVGFETMRDRLKRLIRQGMSEGGIVPRDIAAICAGLAGARLEADRLRMERELRRIGSDLGLPDGTAYTVTTDLDIALRGALPADAEQGILVISGTGSNALGLAGGKLFRSGGWGHLLGDEGSGYALGLEALKLICRASDRREPPTQLTDAVLTALGFSGETDLIAYMYRAQPPKDEIARIAKLVIEAARRSDQAAIRLLRQAADDLIDLVRGLHRMADAFGAETPVVVAGSILTYADPVRDRFAEQLREEGLGRLQPSQGGPLDGALAVACRSIAYPKLTISDGDTQ